MPPTLGARVFGSAGALSCRRRKYHRHAVDLCHNCLKKRGKDVWPIMDPQQFTPAEQLEFLSEWDKAANVEDLEKLLRKRGVDEATLRVWLRRRASGWYEADAAPDLDSAARRAPAPQPPTSLAGFGPAESAADLRAEVSRLQAALDRERARADSYANQVETLRQTLASLRAIIGGGS
jgi:hypothetical protein